MWTDILKGKRERPNIDTHKKKKTEKKEQKRLSRNKRRKIAVQKRLIKNRLKRIQTEFHSGRIGFDAKLLLSRQHPPFSQGEIKYEISWITPDKEKITFGIFRILMFENNVSFFKYLPQPHERGVAPTGKGKGRVEPRFRIQLPRWDNSIKEPAHFEQFLEFIVGAFLDDYMKMRTSMPWAMDTKDHWKETLRGMSPAEQAKFREGVRSDPSRIIPQWRKRANIRRRIRE